MKTDEQLNNKASEIIDSLKGFNLAEKYRIIESLFESLKDTIKQKGGKIVVLVEKKKIYWPEA
ncbi:unnamed protein product [marine sediment metagenome]|uniref:Uncharacterized protein n=1 Tax=marine sediment metagenome TaxID=412755 RepID=X1BU66_9ZZZZ